MRGGLQCSALQCSTKRHVECKCKAGQCGAAQRRPQCGAVQLGAAHLLCSAVVQYQHCEYRRHFFPAAARDKPHRHPHHSDHYRQQGLFCYLGVVSFVYVACFPPRCFVSCFRLAFFTLGVSLSLLSLLPPSPFMWLTLTPRSM